MKFTCAKTQEKAKAPLLMVEFLTCPYEDMPPRWNGHIEICGENTNGVYEALDEFIREQMGGQLESDEPPHCDRAYACSKFCLKKSSAHEIGRRDGFMNGESNMGRWTMRLCDFMVDHLGEWDLIVCNSDNMGRSFATSARTRSTSTASRPGRCRWSSATSPAGARPSCRRPSRSRWTGRRCSRPTTG